MGIGRPEKDYTKEEQNKRIIDIIQKEKKDKSFRIDLGNCNLSELPDELFELTWLEELILSNDWEEYSYELKEWKRFTSKNKGGANTIKSLNPKIKRLKGLKKLVVCGQKDLSDLTPLKDLTQLQQLDVFNTYVSDLTPLKDLKELQHLEVAILVSDLTPLKGLTQLQHINAFKTQVSDLTPLKDLAKLQVLRVENTQVSNLMPLKDLKQLQELYISETPVSDLTPLKDILQLQLLYSSSTPVSDLTPLKKLTQLKYLYVSQTQVSDLAPLKSLGQLQYLNFDNTQVSDLKSLKNLTQLKWLYVSETQVSDLTPLKDLSKLQRLYVSETQVSDLTPLKGLLELQRLSISETQVSDLTPLKDLIELHQLSISETQVSDLTPLKKIIEKGIVVSWTKYGIGIPVKDCPLSNPPKEIVLKGNKAILNYWKQIEEQGGTETINEAKLIIVGEGKSGKTTLFNKLIEPEYVLKTLDETHGINIHEGLEMKDGFRANLWDFGGQELQYMTHQFFLTPRALYILMMDARAESPNLAYWFKIISLLGKDSDGEKVSLLLVFNKRKGGTGSNAYYEILKHYENDFYYIHLEVDFNENDYRWECLKETIQNRLLELPIVKNELPKQWIPIREALREEAKTKNYISTDRLAEICSKYQVNTEEYQFQLTKYLHQLGSLLHFQYDEDLSNTVFLKPQLAVEGVYTILKSEAIKANYGKFKAEDLFNILKSKMYSHGDAHNIMKLMSRNNFDVCYKSENGNYVAAQLLPESAPPQYKWHSEHGVLQFRYQYPIMPKGLMSRLIVRMSSDLEELDGAEIVWKKGAILRIEKDSQTCRVMMCEDDAESKSGLREIIIEVMGDVSYRKFALQKVRDEVEKIHEKWFKNIKVDEMVPCVCNECKIDKEPRLFKLNDLINLQKKNEKAVKQCENSGDLIPIIKLLEGVYQEYELDIMIADKTAFGRKEYFEKSPFEEVIKPSVERKDVELTKQEKKTLKIFLASSNELKLERETFELHFGARKRKTFSYDIEVVLWEDFIDAMSSTRLQDEYNKALKECDIFVMLFFSKVGMYTGEEFEKAFGHFKENGKPLIYTYFKDSNLNTANINRHDLLSLLDFQDKLKELGHFSTHYKDGTDLNFQFSNQLDKLLKENRI